MFGSFAEAIKILGDLHYNKLVKIHLDLEAGDQVSARESIIAADTLADAVHELSRAMEREIREFESSQTVEVLQ